MSRSVKIVTFSFFVLSFLLISELFYLRSIDNEQCLKVKQEFVSFVGLPDLVLSNEPYLRHRSLSSVFDIYSVDPTLREHQKETFILTKGIK